MNEHQFRDRLLRGDLHNVRFTELCRLVKALGFEQRRVSGSYYIFAHPAFPEILNLQQVRGQAQPYQVRQLLRLWSAMISLWRVIGERLPHQRVLQ